MQNIVCLMFTIIVLSFLNGCSSLSDDELIKIRRQGEIEASKQDREWPNNAKSKELEQERARLRRTINPNL